MTILQIIKSREIPYDNKLLSSIGMEAALIYMQVKGEAPMKIKQFEGTLTITVADYPLEFQRVINNLIDEHLKKQL